MLNANPAGESHLRSVAKGVSYRILGTVLTGAFSYVITGSARAALLIGSAEVTAKLVLFWGHERLWDRIAWGRRRRQASLVAMPVRSAAEELESASPITERVPMPSSVEAQRGG